MDDLTSTKIESLFFDAQCIGEPKPRYVAWIDLMGASNIMASSLHRAAIFIGKLHDAILLAQKKVEGVSLHPIVDGTYAISEELDPLLRFTQAVMYRTFSTFCTPNSESIKNKGKFHFQEEQLWRRQALVRASIAYTPIYTPEQMQKGFGLARKYNFPDAYFYNIFVGNLLGEANEAEGKAPPFGIYLCPSVIHQNELLPFERQARYISGCTLYRWFMDSSKKALSDALGLPKSPSEMGQKVIDFLEAEKRNPIESRYPIEKHERWIEMVKEYFFITTNRK